MVLIDAGLKRSILVSVVMTHSDTNQYNVLLQKEINYISDLWQYLQNVENEFRQYDGEPLFYQEMMEEILEGQDQYQKGNFNMFELVDIGVFGFVFLSAPDMIDKILNRFFSDSGFTRID